MTTDIYTDSCGGRWRIERDALGKAVHLSSLDSSTPHTTRSLSGWAALQEFLNDKGEFEKLRAAIDNPPKRAEPSPSPPPESVPTPTRWRSPTARAVPETGDVSPVPCPSCDGSLTIGATACPHCGAIT